MESIINKIANIYNKFTSLASLITATCTPQEHATITMIIMIIEIAAIIKIDISSSFQNYWIKVFQSNNRTSWI